LFVGLSPSKLSRGDGIVLHNANNIQQSLKETGISSNLQLCSESANQSQSLQEINGI